MSTRLQHQPDEIWMPKIRPLDKTFTADVKNVSFIFSLNSSASFLPLVQSLPAASSLSHYHPLLPVPLLVFVIVIAQRHLGTEGAL